MVCEISMVLCRRRESQLAAFLTALRQAITFHKTHACKCRNCSEVCFFLSFSEFVSRPKFMTEISPTQVKSVQKKKFWQNLMRTVKLEKGLSPRFGMRTQKKSGFDAWMVFACKDVSVAELQWCGSPFLRKSNLGWSVSVLSAMLQEGGAAAPVCNPQPVMKREWALSPLDKFTSYLPCCTSAALRAANFCHEWSAELVPSVKGPGCRVGCSLPRLKFVDWCSGWESEEEYLTLDLEILPTPNIKTCSRCKVFSRTSFWLPKAPRRQARFSDVASTRHISLILLAAQKQTPTLNRLFRWL